MKFNFCAKIGDLDRQTTKIGVLKFWISKSFKQVKANMLHKDFLKDI